MTKTLSCISCLKELEPALLDYVNQPYKGTTFISHGHYGSTVFDPMSDSKYLEINVCDECLVYAAKNQFVLYVNGSTTELWDGDSIG